MSGQNFSKKSENGQILILLALGMVALLGFTALAIDGGMYFSDRRYSQNTADAAAFAGAHAAALALENANIFHTNMACGSTAVLNAKNAALDAAIARAASNGFSIERNLNNQHGVEIGCSGKNVGGYLDKYIDVQVMISSTIETSFAHLFFDGELKNTVDAIVRVRPRSNLAMGYAIASLGNVCANNQGGVVVSGSPEVTISGGGIFSTSCMEFAGNKLRVYVSPPELGVNYITELKFVPKTSGDDTRIQPPPVKATRTLPNMTPPTPNCSSLTNRGSHSGSGTLLPGRYSSIRISSSNHALTLSPGLYCINNDLSASGGSLTGRGVTIFMSGGNFSVSGNVSVTLSAPTENDPPAMRGMLIYMPPTNSGVISMYGSSGSSYQGTVYAPRARIMAGGSSTINPTYRTQLLGSYVELQGNTNIAMHFSPEENYQLPAFMDLNK